MGNICRWKIIVKVLLKLTIMDEKNSTKEPVYIGEINHSGI